MPINTNRNTTTTQTIKPFDSITPSLKTELFGDWDKAKKLINNLEPAIKLGGIAGQQAIAKRIYELVRKRIRDNGDGQWRNSEKYENWKGKVRPGKVGQIYRLTGTYYKNIEIFNKGLNYYVGLKPRKYAVDIKGRNKGITLHSIAQILEYGTQHISPKPLWGPVRKKMSNTQIKTLMLWHIRKQIKIMSGV